MEIVFQDDSLDRLETDAEYDGGLPAAVVRSYRKRLQAIRAASDERDLYAIRSHRFKKLKGKKSHQHAMRLNNQWRLVVEIREGSPKNLIAVIAVEDYHR